MTLVLYPTDQHESADSGQHPNRRLVRTLLLAIFAVVLFMVFGPDSVQYTMVQSSHDIVSSGAI